MLDEFYSAAFRKKVYTTIEPLQADVDEWLRYYNEETALRTILLWQDVYADGQREQTSGGREDVEPPDATVGAST
jgi:hypothetical protein